MLGDETLPLTVHSKVQDAKLGRRRLDLQHGRAEEIGEATVALGTEASMGDIAGVLPPGWKTKNFLLLLIEWLDRV